MRGKSLLGAIVLLSAAAAANATPIKWTEAEPAGERMTLSDHGGFAPELARFSLARSAYDDKAFGFSGLDDGQVSNLLRGLGHADRYDVSIASLLSDFFLGHSRLIRSHDLETPVAATAVAEPATLGLLGLGLFGVGFATRRNRRSMRH